MGWCTHAKLDGAVANFSRRHLLCSVGAFTEEASSNRSGNCADLGFSCYVDAPTESGIERGCQLLSKYR